MLQPYYIQYSTTWKTKTDAFTPSGAHSSSKSLLASESTSSVLNVHDFTQRRPRPGFLAVMMLGEDSTPNTKLSKQT